MTNRKATYLSEHEKEILDAVMTLLQDMQVPADSGERVLLWAAGCSLGLRQASLFEAATIEPLARGWRTAAEHG